MTTPERQGDPPVIAHTPDGTQYHNLGDVVATTGHRLSNGTVIPRATKDGRSQGFNEHQPHTVVLVDTTPDNAAPSVIADVRAIAARAGELGDTDEDMFEVYQRLGATPIVGGGGTGVERLPPPMPGFVVPASTSDGGQVRPVPRPAALPPTNTAVIPKSGEVSAADRVPLVASGASLVSGEQAIAGHMRELKLPFLGPTAVEPEIAVIFDLGQFGQLQSYYHAVSRCRGGLILCFDSRRKSQQYVPPLNMESSIRVLVPSMDIDVQVASLDIVGSVGVLDLIALLICPEIDEQHPADEGLKYTPAARDLGDFSP